MSQALKFLVAGGVATAVQYLLLVAMIEALDAPEVLAAFAAYSLAALLNYGLNYYFTFSIGKHYRHREALPKFVLVALCGVALNTLCFSLLLPFVHYLVAQMCATAVTLALNYLLHKYWIYRLPE
ncbi:GtrA family protein [Microbulbifer sp. SA54]|uniref:GtrA family protein n=1 Tax=Microbulbifer sp. SA54 TaxID=3401577 RepID=UPI003AAD81BE